MSPEETYATTQLVKRLVGDGELSILFVEHDMDVVFSVSDKIIVMHEGRVIAEGVPEAVRNNEAVRSVYLGEEME
jgi:branched-chain amino acid transport system ATP-binding protein